VFAPKEQDVANELSERIGYDTVKARSRSGPKGLAMRSTSETISEHRRALMLPQELKLLPKSKTFILGTGIPPIIADKIVYYETRHSWRVCYRHLFRSYPKAARTPCSMPRSRSFAPKSRSSARYFGPAR